MWKKILGGIVIFIVAVVSLAMYATSGMTEVADEFFIHVKTKHYNDAYAMLSEDFKNSTSQEQFANFLVQSSLTEYKSADWGNRSFENNTGKLEGTIETKSGGSIPLEINFIKDGDTWKIYSIYKPSTGIQTDQKSTDTQQTPVVLKAKQDISNAKPPTQQVPSHADILGLVQNSTLLFANGVNAKSLSNFYTNISQFWQQRTSVYELDTTFKPFFDTGIDFTVLKDVQPVIDKEPTIDKENELTIEGHYPTTPSVARFKYFYINENGQWKLSGFYLNLK